MAHTDQNVEAFVEDRLAALEPARWQPDTVSRLADLHRRRRESTDRRTRWAAASVVVVAICAAVPGTRAFGARCVGACIAATTRVSQLWRSDEPAATMPRAVGTAIGNMAPDLVGRDAEGALVHLTDLRGHVVVVNFWATWCAPCKQEIPVLNSLHARFAAQGLDVIGVSIDEDGWTAVNPFATDQHMSYRLALADDSITATFGGVPELPTTFVIDREGRVVAKRVGILTENADDALEKLIRGQMSQR